MFIDANMSGSSLGLLMVFTIIITGLGFVLLGRFLPTDRGREYAFQGGLSQGKRTSSGALYVTIFFLISTLVLKVDWEIKLYLIAVYIEMITGFLDDNSRVAWGELQKGLLDLAVSIFVALVYVRYNTNAVHLALFGTTIYMPYPILFFLIIVLCWMAVNMTNITDGVDGLSSSLMIIYLLSVLALGNKLGTLMTMKPVIVVYISVLMVYLWLNTYPSSHLMGDAGSRAMGLFSAVVILKSGAPFMYIPLALVFIIDGCSSLVKLSVIRLTKRPFMDGIMTPIHDHVRRKWKWSNPQTAVRFALIQLIVTLSILWMI